MPCSDKSCSLVNSHSFFLSLVFLSIFILLSFFPSFVLSFLFNHAFIHSFIHSFNQSINHSFIHSFFLSIEIEMGNQTFWSYYFDQHACLCSYKHQFVRPLYPSPNAYLITKYINRIIPNTQLI